MLFVKKYVKFFYRAEISKVRESFINASIIVPDRYMGNVMQVCHEFREVSKNYQYLTSNRMEMKFELPLAEVVYEFYDRLKSVTQGYGSFDYEICRIHLYCNIPVQRLQYGR